MVCLYCGGDTGVTNSRHQKRINQVWRRRRCKKCLATFTTHETVELSGAVLVDDGSLTPFAAEKLFVSVLEALKSHKDSHATARELSLTITSRLLSSRKQIYSSKEISRQTAATLKRFNRQAYLRYVAEHPSLQQ